MGDLTQDRRPSIRWYVGGAVFAVTVSLGVIAVFYFVACTWEERGQRGDWFGSTLAAGAGIASAVLFFGALLLQRAELDLQRTELRENRSVLQRQTFKQTFSQLLNLLADVRSRFDFVHISIMLPGEKTRNVALPFNATGIGGLNRLRVELRSRAQREFPSGVQSINDIDRWYADQYDYNLAPILGHYFRLLYRIFNSIHEAKFGNETDDTRQHFAKIVRATLSDDELWLLFYNCASRKGRAKFMPMADKYNLFDNLRVDSLLTPEHRTLTGSSMES